MCVLRDGLHDVLAVVEVALDGEVHDVVVLEAEHLRALEAAHAAMRAQHDDPDAGLAAHGVLGRAPGVAGRRAEDVEFVAALRERVKC